MAYKQKGLFHHGNQKALSEASQFRLLSLLQGIPRMPSFSLLLDMFSEGYSTFLRVMF